MDEQRKADLIATIERNRSRIAANREGLADDLKVGEKIKRNIGNHRLTWLGGAILVGIVIAKLPPRTKKVVVDPKGRKQRQENIKEAGKAGMAVWAAKMIIDAAKPALMAWATKRLGEVLHQQQQTQETVEETKAHVRETKAHVKQAV